MRKRRVVGAAVAVVVAVSVMAIQSVIAATDSRATNLDSRATTDTAVAAKPLQPSRPTRSGPAPIAKAAATTGGIAGTVTAVGGAALWDICVTASGGPNATGVASGATRTDGTYTLTGLVTGPYTVGFATGCGNNGNYVAQEYNNQASLRSADSVSVTAPQTTVGINAVLAVGGTMTGTVTAAGGGPLSGICVSFGFGSANHLGSLSAITGSDGTYSITALPAGLYSVTFSGTCGNSRGYLSQVYNSAVRVTAAQTTSNINAALTAGGTILGTVTALGGGPIVGICVTVGTTGGSGFGSTQTRADGTYGIGGLATGRYTVRFEDCSNAGTYGTQYYNNQPQTSPTPVSVTAPQTTAAIDAAMAAGGAITGTVTAAAGGPLTGICVTVFSGVGHLYPPAGVRPTASGGTYTVTGLGAGSYTVEFASGCGNSGSYVTQDYNNQPQASPSPVSVTAGHVTGNINASLVAGGTISGTVTAAGGPGLYDICVSVFPTGAETGPPTVSTSTLSDGTYSAAGLAAGTYTVQFADCGGGYFTQYYKNQTSAQSANPVSVILAQTTNNIDAVMVLGATISGTVTAAGGGTLPGICVAATPTVGSRSRSAVTALDGTYSVIGLATGTYTIEFSSGCGATSSYVTQDYNHQPSATSANPVSVNAPNITANIDASLSPAPAAPIFTADTPPAGATVGTGYSYTFTATGNPVATFAVASGSLPAGLSLNATTGILSGTPTTAGSATFTATAANTVTPNATSQPITITVTPALAAPVFTADSPPVTATVGSAYAYTFTATGYPAPTFAATGTLAAGLTLTMSGVLSGTPSAAGPATFTVTAANTVAPDATSPSITITVNLTLKGYQSIVPVRICDTRAKAANVAANQCNGNGSGVGTLGPKVAGPIVVTGANGVPASAIAVVLNVTATNTTDSSYLTLWPTGATQPTASNLNWTAGQTVPNLVEVAVGTGGQVNVYNNSGMTDVAVDLEGYVDASAPGLFNPLAPTRICDTRAARADVVANQCDSAGHGAGTMGVGKIVVTAAGVPSGATAVVLNVTATGPTAQGYLTAWPDGAATMPTASNLNWMPGQTVPNRVIVPLGPGGKFDLFNSAGATDVIVDVNGYYSPTPGGSGYIPQSPTRLCDTRPVGATVAANTCNAAAQGGPHPIAAGRELVLASPPGIATVFNVTVTNPTAGSYLTVFPDSNANPATFATPPLISDLNWVPGQTVANLVVVGSGSTQTVVYYNSLGSTDLIVDVEGTYNTTPAAGPVPRPTATLHR